MPEFNLYGLIVGLGILAAYEVALKMNRKLVEPGFWWAVIPGIIGARAYHVIDLWGEYYRFNLLKSLYIWEGGLGIWGAIIGGLMGLWVYTRLKGESFKELVDVVVVGVPLGQAIGRWGNFFNNELWGKEGRPLFLYESVLNLILFGILWRMRKRKGGAGVYLIGYGLIRFLLEFLRPEGIIWRIGGLAVAQIMAVAAMLGGGIYFFKASLRTSSR